jgi:hypothetical protein
MSIKAKSSHNHYLILCFLHQFLEIQFEDKFNFKHIIKFNILIYIFFKYEIISLTFGPSKIV